MVSWVVWVVVWSNLLPINIWTQTVWEFMLVATVLVAWVSPLLTVGTEISEIT